MKAFCAGFVLGLIAAGGLIYYAQFIPAWGGGESDSGRDDDSAQPLEHCSLTVDEK